jgi:hypothetical protein
MLEEAEKKVRRERGSWRKTRGHRWCTWKATGE